MNRPHCLNVTACAAKTPGKHCRSCSAARLRSDPAIEAKRHAAVKAYTSRPEVKAKLAKRIQASQAKAFEDPAVRERLREHGRKQHREVLSRPEVRAATYNPATNALRGESCRATWLAWCPVELRDEYRRLVYTKRMLAHEARAAIEEIMDEPKREELRAARCAIAEINQRQADKRAREIRDAY